MEKPAAWSTARVTYPFVSGMSSSRDMTALSPSKTGSSMSISAAFGTSAAPAASMRSVISPSSALSNRSATLRVVPRPVRRALGTVGWGSASGVGAARAVGGGASRTTLATHARSASHRAGRFAPLARAPFVLLPPFGKGPAPLRITTPYNQA
jgi:hypothetical protein